jgi:PAS domain S-box-containing protein
VQTFRRFSDASPLGVFHTDCDGMANYANAVCCEITGLHAESLLGSGWTSSIHADDRPRVLSDWRDACATRAALDIACRIVRPDGKRRYVRLLGRPCPVGTEPDDCYMGVVLDMTDQVVAERRLRNNNILLQAILANIPCGVTVFAPDGSLVLDNQKFRTLLSLPDGAAPGQITDFGTLGLSDRPAAMAAYPDTAPEWSASAAADVEPRVREEAQPDGRVLELREAPMPMGGIVTTFTDITSHKQIIETLQQAKREAEQAAAAKAAFLATMSHEIRTPMNGVIGMTNVLLETELTADQRELVDVIRQSGESLLVVINDVLDYSRIESGQMELEWLPFRVSDVVRNSVRLLEAKARERSVAIEVSIAQDIPALILGDRTRLQQVLVNLVSNAVKFTEHGQVRIAVVNLVAESRLQGGELPGDICTLEVSVEDTGIGIAQDKLSSVFEPFVQADSSTSRRFGGTGLGLAIARKLVEAMGGTIHLSSQPGVGTKARFSFLAETAVPRNRAGAGVAPLWRKRVLILSGPRADVSVLASQLKRWGMVIESCRTAEEAATRMKASGGFDLLLAAGHALDAAVADLAHSLRNEGVTLPILVLARRKAVDPVDPALGVRVLARTASESSLYDELVDAIHACGEPPAAESDTLPQFDGTLAARMPLRIMVAEDNEINRKVALRMLAAFGYEAEVARNGLEVVELVQQRSYDLVLMDIQMPGLDGIEATRFIARNLPGADRPRIVVMSASVLQEHLHAALAAGADAFIAKPFAAAELRAALEQAADRPGSSGAKSPLAAASEPDLLSAAKLRGHLLGDPTGAFLLDLIETLEREGPQLLARMRMALAARAVAALRSTLHEYAGACAVMGAERLMRCLLRIQELVKEGALDQVSRMIDRCAVLQAETQEALRAAVAEHRQTQVTKSNSR